MVDELLGSLGPHNTTPFISYIGYQIQTTAHISRPSDLTKLYRSHCNDKKDSFFCATNGLPKTYIHHAVASTAAGASVSPGVSDCFSVGATAAATASLRRRAAATTSSTSASPARHPARRLTNNAHSCGPNTRAAARVTRNVCAGCASLAVNNPARIAMKSVRCGARS